jgi:hypothetical protein
MASSIYISIVVSVAALFGVCGALQCFQCGQYNDGVGSITPCLNYTANLAHLHLKECARSSDKFCIVSTKEIMPIVIQMQTGIPQETYFLSYKF